jgi:hypothetical protein
MRTIVKKLRGRSAQAATAVGAAVYCYLACRSLLARIILHAIETYDGVNAGVRRGDARITSGQPAPGADSIVHSFQNVTADLITPVLAGAGFLILIAGVIAMWGSTTGANHKGYLMFKHVVIGAIAVACAVPLAN